MNLRIDSMIIDNQLRNILFQHSGTKLVYSSIEVASNSALTFGVGMDPSVWFPDKGDGVEYNIYVTTPENPLILERIYHQYIDPKNNSKDRHWFDENIDLSKFAGKKVDFIFEALPGPSGDSNFDWGGWSNPILVSVPESIEKVNN